MGVPGAVAGASADSGRGVDERTASGGTAWGLLMIGIAPSELLWAPGYLVRKSAPPNVA